MAKTRYNEIDEKSEDEELLAKIRTALKNSATAIAKDSVKHNPGDDNYPTDKERTWARGVLYNAKHEAVKALNILLIDQKGIQNVDDLNGFPDDAVQSKVDQVVKYLILAQAGE